MAIPKTFTGGERLFAEDLNSNFEALDTSIATTAFNATDASNLTSGTVAAARLGDVPAANITGKVVEARLPFVRGRVSTSSSGGVTITFPEGSFTSAPTVLLGPVALGPRLASHRGATSSSFIADSYQLDGNRNDIGLDWLAVGT